MKFIRILLFPLVPIYFLVTWTRNILFDKGLLKSKAYNIPIICVGNLSTGGTGKTPMIEYLVRLLYENHELAILSRGYKRDTKGFILADSKSSVLDIGDEPFQFYRKFDSLSIAVAEKRVEGIDRLLALDTPPNCILLDDAYQHRYVKAGFNILLTSYQQPFFEDIVLPTGNLREPKSGSKRADIIIITKCPGGLGQKEKKIITQKLKLLPNQSVFFSSITYSQTVFNHNEQMALSELKSFTLVTGIAYPDPLIQFLKEEGLVFKHLSFPDHHTFSPEEVIDLSKESLIITTEKDFVRLSEAKELNSNLWYLPIEFVLDDPNRFKNLVLNFTKN
ncbi:tetraacyldisaccharide 4'-kinase [Winogradskyella aurantiaca]|uniref:tetraacyldisaccharide 4'-kinase n=1 Tax=Winogradskyella aurantiaca TaxID=2219558 RepID=UPI000E1D9F96|nr:tetraacyldisaccharide 4'-kinase [Winogradskyella aurantiaca]